MYAIVLLLGGALPQPGPAIRTQVVPAPRIAFHSYEQVGAWCARHNVFQVGTLTLTEDGYVIEDNCFSGNVMPGHWRYARYVQVLPNGLRALQDPKPCRWIQHKDDPTYFVEPLWWAEEPWRR